MNFPTNEAFKDISCNVSKANNKAHSLNICCNVYDRF